MVYATCGILGLFKEEYDVSSVCDPTTTRFENGKCVPTVDVTAGNASVCDLSTTRFENGKCVSTVDVTMGNASVFDPATTRFENGKCVSTVDVTADNASLCDSRHHTRFHEGKGKCVSSGQCPKKGAPRESGYYSGQNSFHK